MIYRPQLITAGVMSVKIAVDRIPKLRVYFPPYLAESTPPGMWVAACYDEKLETVKATFKLAYISPKESAKDDSL